MNDTESGGMATAPPIVGFHHVDLTVTDIDRSVEWYGRVFGFTKLLVAPHQGASTGYAVVLEEPRSGMHLGLDHHDGNEGEPFSETRTGLDHLSFHLAGRSELEDWCAHLNRLGVAFSPIIDIEGPLPLSVLAFRDPDNIQLELFVIR